MAEKAFEKAHETKDVDISAAPRGVWLVKVPKYLSERWEKPGCGSEVGKLRITRSNAHKPEVVFTASDSVMAQEGSIKSAIPRQHKFALTSALSQNITVFSQNSSADQVHIEGKVMQRAECHPVADNSYMQLKRKQLEIKNKPKREIVLLQNVVPMYKPRSHQVSSLEDKRRSKDSEKRSRLDKEKVMDMLFAAFEKHQYYNVKDLVGITKQPIPYLKEILQEICVYNMKAPHKNMWELKPEFRHYKQTESST